MNYASIRTGRTAHVTVSLIRVLSTRRADGHVGCHSQSHWQISNCLPITIPGILHRKGSQEEWIMYHPVGQSVNACLGKISCIRTPLLVERFANLCPSNIPQQVAAGQGRHPFLKIGGLSFFPNAAGDLQTHIPTLHSQGFREGGYRRPEPRNFQPCGNAHFPS